MKSKKLSLFPLILALSLSLSACATTEREKKEMEQENMVRSLKEENEVGRQMAAKLAGTVGLHEGDDALLKYINLVGKTVAMQANRPEIAFRFAVLKDEEINAFATPGGYIFVTKGLLRQVRNEAELAGILGHEVAHVTERHMYKAIMPKREVDASETFARMLSRGGSDIGHSIGKIVNSGMDILLQKGLGQEKEHEADSVGIVYSMAAGYDPSALYGFLTRLEQDASSVKVSKTHPPFPQRLKDLKAFMDSNGMVITKKADTEMLNARYKQAVLKLQQSKVGKVVVKPAAAPAEKKGT